MELDHLLAEGAARLAAAGVEHAALDARLLFEHLTGLEHSQLILRARETVAEPVATRFREMIGQRATRIPLQHLTGIQEFWSLEFTVSPAVLVPRPETEFLLAQIVNSCGGERIAAALDLCTGSGVIAVVLARELGCPVIGVDISPAALTVAAINAARHGVGERVALVCGDLFAPLAPGRRFPLIVSNPPYVAQAEIDHLEPEVRCHEPRLALDGGADGLAVIDRIAAGALDLLEPGGRIFLEIGADQGQKVLALFTAEGYGDVRVLTDWAGRPRVLQARA